MMAAGIDGTDETAGIVANATETATGHTALHPLHLEATDTAMSDTATVRRNTTEVAGSAEALV
jgi:hypothetical protein